MSRSIIWTKFLPNELDQIVRQATTYTEILARFDLRNIGHNLNTLKKRLDLLVVNHDHLKDGAGRKHSHLIKQRIRTLEDGLPITQIVVRNLILASGQVPYVCKECGSRPEWNGKPLTLQLDHIDGDHNNRSVSNFRFLCPNCHSQTDNFAGRKLKHRTIRYCNKCPQIIPRTNKSGCCNKCSRRAASKIIWPTNEELRARLGKQSCTSLADELGVSATAITRRFK